jgi:hypothetical protein
MPDFFEGEPWSIDWSIEPFICSHPRETASDAWGGVSLPDPSENILTSLSSPPVTDDQKKNLYGWFSTHGPNIAVDRLPRIPTDIEATYVKKRWAALGVSSQHQGYIFH